MTFEFVIDTGEFVVEALDAIGYRLGLMLHRGRMLGDRV